ncbi:PH domain leucine-rich repeat-containing protein phosphatase 2 [Biomphalaria pfeifferi]|uniref:PH domain leucine-rich repeat-containing protein phosphatase 2 n=1 Tax=Biomphalaria pfeifferi TaxID=112525 RepID=A0AAD8F621_BIOPF|nr:PH domain leucine-rich repeat-containing protein phosphatase 2 [Biomphalaria pfeifferi]
MSALTETVTDQTSKGVTIPDFSKKSISKVDNDSQPVSVPHYSQRYHGGKAWWSVGELQHQGITHQSVGLSLGRGDEETWDLSDSLADLYQAVTRKEQRAASRHKAHVTPAGGSVRVDTDKSLDIQRWLDDDTSHGFIRVFQSDTDGTGRLFPCTLSTPAQKICLQLGIPGNALHVQLSGDVIRRMEAIDCPLAIQNEYLAGLGYSDIRYIQEAGPKEDLAYLVRFYAGKPASLTEHTYSRNHLTTYTYIRKGKLLHQWVRRRCSISGTRMLIYRENHVEPTTVQLARGSVEEVTYKGQSLVLKITTTYPTERSMYMSFVSPEDYNKWLRKLKKATSKMPDKADLSNCHLEFLPENVFVNTDLKILVLRHNALRERPIEEDIYTIGWLEDLPRFSSLRMLNLADNQLLNFPSALCQMKSLVELNLSSNKLNEVPPEISDLVNLKVLHLHNNCLSSIPDEIADMRSLCHIVLAFNQFSQIPAILLQSKLAAFLVDSVIMAGNLISRLPADQFIHMTKIKKIDLRLNQLHLMPTETAKFQSLEHVTHLDIRENQITDLDIRAIRSLEYLNCDHNAMRSMQLNGSQLKNVFASHNCLQTLSINPKPEYLSSLTISHNKLIELPGWLADCFFLTQLDVSHNLLKVLPDRLLTDAKRLKVLKANHNRLTELPEKIRSDTLEELHLQHNYIRHLSTELFIKAHRLRYLNMTKNKLVDLPAPNKNDSYNKLQELYLSFNYLSNQCLYKICCFPRLRVLHLAKNKIAVIEEVDIEKLEQLTELNVSSNNLTYLPSAVGRHPKLQVLRANCNLLKELPNLKSSSVLKVLEVSSNHLVKVNLENLLSSHMSVLDITANPTIQIKGRDNELTKTSKKLCMVDVRGQNPPVNESGSQTDISVGQLWRSGLSQTSGIRNKLSVTSINKPFLNDNGEALFAIFDGGRNDVVASQLCDIIPTVLKEERSKSRKPEVYLKNLKHLGEKLGAAAVVVHIHKDDKENYILSVANVGDAQVVLYRNKKPMLLSRPFLVAEDVEDTKRVVKSGGIITEDGRVSGVTYNTRLLGCSYLYPYVIPEPHVSSTVLTLEDTLFIVASQGLWQYVTYEEAVAEIKDTPDPVVAAKRLQDLAQGYGSRENIAVLVVRLMLSEAERSRITDLMRIQRKSQKELLKALSQPKDILHFRDGVPRGEELNGIIIDKSGHAKRHRSGRKNLLDSESIRTSPSNEEFVDTAVSNETIFVSLHSNDSHPIDTAQDHTDSTNVMLQDLETQLGEKRLYRKKSHGPSHLKKHVPSAETDEISRVHESSADMKSVSPNDSNHASEQQRDAEENDILNSENNADISEKMNTVSDSSQLPPPMESDYVVPYDGFDDDPYNRLSFNGGFSVSPTESISSIDTSLHHEIDNIYMSRHEIIHSKNEVDTWRNNQNFEEAEQELVTRPLSPDSLISQTEFIKPMVSMTNIDRDALLFHQMQLARAQAHSGSITSLDSIQSAPMHGSKHDIYHGAKTSSHSIEVLVNVGENDSFSGGHVEWGSSLSGLNSGATTVHSSKIVNIDSGSEGQSQLLDNFLESSVQAAKEHQMSNLRDAVNEDDDADTLVGEDNDIGNLNDVMSDEEIQLANAKQHAVEEKLTLADNNHQVTDEKEWSHRTDQETLDEGSDSDDSIGNVSLEDGYFAIEFPVSQKKGSLSMLNIVDIESNKYLQNFSNLKNVARHEKSKFLQMNPRRAPSYSSSHSHRSSRALKTGPSGAPTDHVRTRSFSNLTYEEISHFQNRTSASSIIGEKDIDSVYAVVSKVKKNKNKEKKLDLHEEDQAPMLIPFDGQKDSVPTEDVMEQNLPSRMHSPHNLNVSAHKSSLQQRRNSQQQNKSEGRDPYSSSPPINGKKSSNMQENYVLNLSTPFECNTKEDNDICAESNITSLSFTQQAHETDTSMSSEDLPPPLPPRPPYFTPLGGFLSDDRLQSKSEHAQPVKSPPVPARRHQAPPAGNDWHPTARPRRSLSKKSLNMESGIDNTVLSAQDLYPDVLQPASSSSSFPSSIDVSSAVGKLSHQRSIIITYL